MKRFYRNAALAQNPGGWSIELDGRPVLTPAKEKMFLPAPALAEAIASEWNAQEKSIMPRTMPLMQLAATAIDRTRGDRDRVIAQTVAYGFSDLVCYRAGEPSDLVRRQADAWDPLIQWVRQRYDIALAVTTGIVAVRQPVHAGDVFARALGALDDFALTAMSAMTEAAGSLVVALALANGRLDAAAAAEATLLDETFQAEKWGLDPEMEARHREIRGDLAAGARFLLLLRS
jgi:chaperone required for assembly of F1-ATPase